MDRATLLVVALCLATACATPTPPPAPLALPAGDPRPAALVAAWVGGAADRRSMRCRAHLALDSENHGGRVRSKQVLVLARPARLRVEVMGFMNQTAAVIATDGQRFEVFRAADASYEAGPVDPGLLWREAQLALTPIEVVDVLLGASAALGGLSPANAARTGTDWIRMDLVDAAGVTRRRVSFDDEGHLRELEVMGSGGAWLWRASFDAYADVAGTPVAHLVVIDLAVGSTRVEISLRDVELNPALPPDIFRLRAPATAGATRGEGG